MFVERIWGLLKSWDNNFSTLEHNNDDTVLNFISDESEYWGFSEFYFLAEDESCIMPDGTKETMDFGGAWNYLTEQNKPIIAN